MIAKSPNVLFCDLYDLQRERAGVMVDTRLNLDDGELSMVTSSGGLDWSFLDRKAQQFVDILYAGQNVISNEHFTVIEKTGVTDEFVCNNNSDCDDVKLEPYKSYDQVKCQYCWKDFNKKWQFD